MSTKAICTHSAWAARESALGGPHAAQEEVGLEQGGVGGLELDQLAGALHVHPVVVEGLVRRQPQLPRAERAHDRAPVHHALVVLCKVLSSSKLSQNNKHPNRTKSRVEWSKQNKCFSPQVRVFGSAKVTMSCVHTVK